MRFYLPIFGPGPFTNLGAYPHWSNRVADAAWTNASAHVAWALAIPLLGYFISPLVIVFYGCGIGWVLWTLIYEGLLHAPDIPSPSYSAEIRTDLLTRLVPTLILFLIEALR